MDRRQEPIKWPKRVQILIDDYLKAGKEASKKYNLHYAIESFDTQELRFEQRVENKPASYKIMINSIYRVRNLDGEEFYYYSATKSKDDLNHDITFTHDQFGYHKIPKVTMQYNEGKNEQEPHVSGYRHGFELPWNKDEVKKLLESSAYPCEQFYVGHAGGNANDPVADRRYMINNLQDFVEGPFNDLIDLGRL